MLLGQTTTTTSIPATSASSITHLSGNDWIVARLAHRGSCHRGRHRHRREPIMARRPHRRRGQRDPVGLARAPDRTLIRSWLAVSLAGGLPPVPVRSRSDSTTQHCEAR